MKNPIYWIGIRESEIDNTHDLFSGSITIFGTGEKANSSFERAHNVRFDYNQDYPAWYQFVKDCAQEIIENDPKCVFMLYDPMEINEYGQEVAKRTICQNPGSLLEMLDNKFKARQWLSTCVPILPYWMQQGKDINYNDLLQAFPGIYKFVVQASTSYGGSGTFLLTKENQVQICESLNQDTIYAVSPYKENSVSPNIHIVIYDDSVILLPPSLQLIIPDEHGFSYRGADYPVYNSVSEAADRKLRNYALQIGSTLKNAGYRGICGIDFLVDKTDVFFMEVNARFQSSTFLLNLAFDELQISKSMQELHLHAFKHLSSPQLPSDFMVPFSFFHYAFIPDYASQLQYIHRMLQYSETIYCIDDSLDWSMGLERYTYLYKVVFRRHIAAISPENRCRIHTNIGIDSARISADDLCNDRERLKVMLLSHGTRLSERAKNLLETNGGFNHEEFDALDLVLAGQQYVSVPYEANLSQLSPFCVDVGVDNSLFLSYYGQEVVSIRVRNPDPLGEQQTVNGVFYHDITYLTNDRLRVYQRPGCFFKDHNLGCKFCDMPRDEAAFSIEDILRVVDEYRNHPNVRHYLMGGGSTAPDDDLKTAITIAKHIKETTQKPIYLMSLPPYDVKRLEDLYIAGVTEVAFNLEIFDRNLAEQFMPGKGAIPLSVYDDAFCYATKLWGKSGNVRTIFVVGLEPASSLLEGIEHVAQLGVAPILSLFRPMPETPLQEYLAPSDDEIWYIYQEAKRICSRYGLELGPSCPYCEDNTLKVTL